MKTLKFIRHTLEFGDFQIKNFFKYKVFFNLLNDNAKNQY